MPGAHGVVSHVLHFEIWVDHNTQHTGHKRVHEVRLVWSDKTERLGYLCLVVHDDRKVYPLLLKLVGVADPHFVVHFTVDAEAVHAHIPRIKLLLQLGHRRQGRHADRIEVLWHGEDHDPLALDGVVKRDEALSRVTAEIRHVVAELKKRCPQIDLVFVHVVRRHGHGAPSLSTRREFLAVAALAPVVPAVRPKSGRSAVYDFNACDVGGACLGLVFRYSCCSL
mmetsp:Transcript_21267/g.54903  ORF Transcript_21267/g.54903 Transcript_21267/m.54903 type:complete len:224 (+) Transcript_21267:412-1083(+)